LKLKKIAAIDIGSNAVRLLISNVVINKGQKPTFTKNALVRVPIRLGQDSFTVGEISKKNRQRMIDAMKAFRLLLKIHNVELYMACGTSALREANNSQQLVNKIHKKTGIKIDIIDGRREAEIIASSELYDLMKPDKSYLYVDVGGGSTELTVFSKGTILASKSFKIGTVRLLNKMVSDDVWNQLRLWVSKHTHELEKVAVVGSGGNINKLFKLSGKKYGTPLTYIYMNDQYELLNKMSYAEMVSDLRLNPDRADVIVPATRIYLMAMKYSGASHIHVPKTGLADGMVKLLYKEKSSKKS